MARELSFHWCHLEIHERAQEREGANSYTGLNEYPRKAKSKSKANSVKLITQGPVLTSQWWKVLRQKARKVFKILTKTFYLTNG
jgi:hypothetical protein